jgi:hypothetical protein
MSARPVLDTDLRAASGAALLQAFGVAEVKFAGASPANPAQDQPPTA